MGYDSSGELEMSIGLVITRKRETGGGSSGELQVYTIGPNESCTANVWQIKQDVEGRCGRRAA